MRTLKLRLTQLGWIALFPVALAIAYAHEAWGGPSSDGSDE